MADHDGVLAHIRGCASLTELGALQAAVEERTAALIAAAEAPAAKRARTGNPVPAGEDIVALARVPVSEADVAGKSEIRLLLNVSAATWLVFAPAGNCSESRLCEQHAD
jgi:hypothetical protein